mmetsp:Transcript_97239/g.308459  ORF Transcript_97239/g.308459 Transcript_97239/m.308459 type:complete len:286 (+) Transcript_97239:47-904(+)
MLRNTEGQVTPGDANWTNLKQNICDGQSVLVTSGLHHCSNANDNVGSENAVGENGAGHVPSHALRPFRGVVNGTLDAEDADEHHGHEDSPREDKRRRKHIQDEQRQGLFKIRKGPLGAVERAKIPVVVHEDQRPVGRPAVRPVYVLIWDVHARWAPGHAEVGVDVYESKLHDEDREVQRGQVVSPEQGHLLQHGGAGCEEDRCGSGHDARGTQHEGKHVVDDEEVRRAQTHLLIVTLRIEAVWAPGVPVQRLAGGHGPSLAGRGGCRRGRRGCGAELAGLGQNGC